MSDRDGERLVRLDCDRNYIVGSARLSLESAVAFFVGLAVAETRNSDACY